MCAVQQLELLAPTGDQATAGSGRPFKKLACGVLSVDTYSPERMDSAMPSARSFAKASRALPRNEMRNNGTREIW